MININIFNFIFRNSTKKELKKEFNKIEYEDNNFDKYKFASLMNYINKKYPNCPNSDYVKLLKKNQKSEL